MIYTVTLNPAVDYVVHLPAFAEGATNRATGEEIYFGGKGINVSLVLRELGVTSTALGFVAGFTGDALEAHLAAAGVQTDFLRLPEGFTRINVKVKSGGRESEINGKGPAVPLEMVEVLLEKLDRLEEGDTLVLAGSVPGTLPSNIYERMLAHLSGRGVRFVVDAEGALLRATLGYRPFLIKPNRRELSGLVGRTLSNDGELAAAARELQAAGAQNVLVSLGGEGALLLDAEGTVHRAPAVGGAAVNTVGAGDSMVAGFLAGISRGYDRALRLGLAAGGATAGLPGLAGRADILALLKG
ncbi:MAG: 1-phosphofructokinase [Ruminococcaceae bacterium]|nr:1-phosphofructokinase [Oscillospiraceae bacterium]